MAARHARERRAGDRGASRVGTGPRIVVRGLLSAVPAGRAGSAALWNRRQLDVTGARGGLRRPAGARGPPRAADVHRERVRWTAATASTFKNHFKRIFIFQNEINFALILAFLTVAV